MRQDGCIISSIAFREKQKKEESMMLRHSLSTKVKSEQFFQGIFFPRETSLFKVINVNHLESEYQ